MESLIVSQKHIRFARQLAFDAGRMLLKGFHNKHTVSRKGVVNLVTEMDLKSEKMIHAAIRREFPDHSILAEEGHSLDTDSPYRWIVDPLDGTTNYAHGYPVWCVSIGLEYKGEIIVGVIYNPNLDELFYASAGKGAFLNKRRIHAGRRRKLSDAFLATGFPYDIRETTVDNLDNFARFYKVARAVRRGGSAAMDLAYTAAGIFDGFWELKLSPWDTAAGKLIAEEAGAAVTDFSGKPYEFSDKELVCANGRLIKEMRRVLLEVRKVGGM